MQNWLNSLERLLRQGRIAILATLVRRTGHSPDAVGTQLLISADQIFGVLSNTERLVDVVAHSRKMLRRRESWSAKSFALRPIVGRENGDCEFIFQMIDQQSAARWLNDAQVAVAQNRSAVLVCTPGEHATLATDVRDVNAAYQDVLSKLLIARDANAVQMVDEHLLIRLPSAPLRIAIAGNGVIAAALIRNLCLLPCRVIWLTSGTPLDSGVPLAPLATSAVDSLADYTHLVIASNNHELDRQLCAHALRHPTVLFIGCLGSTKKATLLRQSLRKDGFDDKQTARVITPVGVPDIVSNHPSVIAISIIAQLFSQRKTVFKDWA